MDKEDFISNNRSNRIMKFLCFFLADTGIIILSLYLSFLLRFEFSLQPKHLEFFVKALPFFIVIKLVTFVCFKLYKFVWRYVSISDLVNIGTAVVVSEAVLMVVILLFPAWFSLLPLQSLIGFPRSIFIVDGLLSFFMLEGLRSSKRIYMELFGKSPKKKVRTIIIGAGNIGETVLRDIIRQQCREYYPVSFLDDDADKIGSYINGVRVSGTIDSLVEAVKRFKAEAVIIAIPSLNYRKLRKIYEMAQKSRVKTIKIVPSMYLQHQPVINIKSLQDIQIEDLIGRQNVTIDYAQVKMFLKDKVVLITGAGGSIGSEIAMQVCSFNPKEVVLLDIDETELHNLGIALKKKTEMFLNNGGEQSLDRTGYPYYLDFVVADIRDNDRIDAIFKKFRPAVVFHAAAYKHVPMMEWNPEEAVKVNIFGTYNLAKAAVAYGVERFIMISTDKAVNPTSVMGASKKFAEEICKAFNGSNNGISEECGLSQTAIFRSVRFGNVLGSRGSVLPLFLKQLKDGGPLTVTDRNMKRYFMTVSEAVALVLQASAIEKGGEVVVLDMGEPVNITSFAEDLIRIHNLIPYEDIKIEFTGIRDGENLFEEIITKDEIPTKYEKIFIVNSKCRYSVDKIEKVLEGLRKSLKSGVFDITQIKAFLSDVNSTCSSN